VPVLRVDRALAEEAVRDGGAVVVLCAVATTLAPRARSSRRRRAHRRLGRGPAGARGLGGLRGRRGRALSGLVATAAEAAARDGAARVALAQASMAGRPTSCERAAAPRQPGDRPGRRLARGRGR